jgi:hypothetical protein
MWWFKYIIHTGYVWWGSMCGWFGIAWEVKSTILTGGVVVGVEDSLRWVLGRVLWTYVLVQYL